MVTIKPELTQALEGLQVLDIAHLPRYKAAVEAGQQRGFAYHFAYLLSRTRPEGRTVLVAEDDGALCVFIWRVRDVGPRLDLCFAPMPMNLAALDRCLERANEFNRDRSARILSIDAKDAPLLARVGHLRLAERRAQYVYAPSSYGTLGGNRFRTLRRHVALVAGLPELEVVPFSVEHTTACRALLRHWQKAHRSAHGTEGAVGTSRRALELSALLPDTDLRGEVVRIGGRVVAFAFGGAIRGGIGCFFEARCDPEIPGLSYFHRRSFLARMMDFELVNDGSDAGRDGLRQLKDCFRPVEMHVEYRARQRKRAPAAR